jgi:hypothetical protein
MTSRLPPHVERFLVENVRSLEQLEILLLLHRAPERSWTAAEVAKELRIEPASAARRLEDLLVRGHAARAEGEAFRGDGPEALRSTIRDLAEAYETLRVTVIQVVYSRPAENIQLFADAFLIRKDGEKS